MPSRLSRSARLTVIGDYRRLKPALVKLIDDAIARTAGNRRIHIVIALNYGARDEMLRPARQLVADAADGSLDPQAIDEAAERVILARVREAAGSVVSEEVGQRCADLRSGRSALAVHSQLDRLRHSLLAHAGTPAR